MQTQPTDIAPTIAIQSDEVTRIASAFYELDEVHRIVLCLHYLEQLSIEEIALVLDDEAAHVDAVYREGLARMDRRPPRQLDAA